MKQNILPALRLTLISILFFCGFYTALIWLIAQVSPGKGEGETISVNDKVAGYKLIGQKFTLGKYFHSRPSAANYNATAAAGTNMGPSNPDYLKSVNSSIDSFIIDNPGSKKSNLPSEMVTSSASGLDPDISPEGAFIQVKRISRERNISEGKIRELIEQHIDKPLAGFFGPEKVNVLQLNIDLDQIK